MLAINNALKKLRPNLLGLKFIIRTDHSSLKSIINFKNINNQFAR